VLGVDTHLAPVDGAVADHHTVAGDVLVLQPEVHRPVRGESIQLGERALVEELVDPGSRGELAAGALLLHRGLGELVRSGLGALRQLGELACGGRGVDRGLGGHISTVVVSTRQPPAPFPRAPPRRCCGKSTTGRAGRGGCGDSGRLEPWRRVRGTGKIPGWRSWRRPGPRTPTWRAPLVGSRTPGRTCLRCSLGASSPDVVVRGAPGPPTTMRR